MLVFRVRVDPKQSKMTSRQFPSQEPDFTCQKCGKSVKSAKRVVEEHLTKHKLTLRDYVQFFGEHVDADLHEHADTHTRGQADAKARSNEEGSTRRQEDLNKVKLWIQTEEYFNGLKQV